MGSSEFSTVILISDKQIIINFKKGNFDIEVEPTNIIQLSLRMGFEHKRSVIDNIIPSTNNHLNPLFSRKNENGNIEAGTHLVFIDNSTCDVKSAGKLTDPKILNYYRQFLIKGIDER